VKLTNEERMLLNSEMQRKGKSMVLAYILLIFLGSLGIHRFYLNQKGTAITMLVLFLVGWATSWIFFIGYLFLIPLWIWVFVDLFLVPGIVNKENEYIEGKIIYSIKQQADGAYIG